MTRYSAIPVHALQMELHRNMFIGGIGTGTVPVHRQLPVPVSPRTDATLHQRPWRSHHTLAQEPVMNRASSLMTA